MKDRDMSLQIRAACANVVGRIRENNEDNLYFDGNVLPRENRGLDSVLTAEYMLDETDTAMAVFDGVGGARDGQVASYMAADCFRRNYEQAEAEILPKRFLETVVLNMNEYVRQAGKDVGSRMGTTAVILYCQGDMAYVCNMGDSRAYLFRNGELKQLSRDHSDADFLASHGVTNRKPMLYQYIGMQSEDMIPEPYICREQIRPGDVFILCSDGVTDMVSEGELGAVIGRQQDVVPMVREVIRRAMDAGGADNTTIIAAKVTEKKSWLKKFFAGEQKR